MAFLTLDVGNTRLKWALYDAPQPGARLLQQGAVFLENIDRLSEDDWKTLPRPDLALGCIVAGEAIRRRVEEQMEAWDTVPRWVVPSSAEAGLSNGYDHPTRLGADRWVAMIGAYARMQLLTQQAQLEPKPMVVVMVGTAVTVEAIDAHGRFLGGAHLARSRHHAQGLGVGHRRTQGPHRRGQAVSHQHLGCAHEWGHLRHCGSGAKNGGALERGECHRTLVLHDGRRGLENGPQHVDPH